MLALNSLERFSSLDGNSDDDDDQQVDAVVHDFCAFQAMLDARGFAFVPVDPELYGRCVDEVFALRQRIREPGRFCRGALGEMRLSSTPSRWVELYLTRSRLPLRRQTEKEAATATTRRSSSTVAAFVHRLEPVCFQAPGEPWPLDWRRAATRDDETAEIEGRTAPLATRDSVVRVAISLLGRDRKVRVFSSTRRRRRPDDEDHRHATKETRLRRSSFRSLDLGSRIARALVYFDTRAIVAARNRTDTDWCTLDYSFVSADKDPFDFSSRLSCLKRGLCPWLSEHARLFVRERECPGDSDDAEFASILRCPAATSHPRPLTSEQAAFLLKASSSSVDGPTTKKEPLLLPDSPRRALSSPCPFSARRPRRLRGELRCVRPRQSAYLWQDPHRRRRRLRRCSGRDVDDFGGSFDADAVARLERVATEIEDARSSTRSVGVAVPMHWPWQRQKRRGRSRRRRRDGGSDSGSGLAGCRRGFVPILEHELIWNDLMTSLEDFEEKEEEEEEED